jgi:hypothetical protein
MQTDRSRRLVALALGTTAVFDITGSAIYRVVRASMPPPPAPASQPSPFQQATEELLGARREAVAVARDEEGVTVRA